MFIKNSKYRCNICLQIFPEETDEDFARKSPLEPTKKSDKSDVINMPTPELHSVGGVLVHMPHVSSSEKFRNFFQNFFSLVIPK